MVVSPLWKAVHRLREAEALAGLGSVAGPLDAPPEKPEDEDSWTRDWLTRAKAAFKRAVEMHEEASRKGVEVVRERARTIAQRLRDGAAGVLQGAKNVAKTTRDEVQSFLEKAQQATFTWASLNTAFAVGAIVFALWYFTRRRRRRFTRK